MSDSGMNHSFELLVLITWSNRRESHNCLESVWIIGTDHSWNETFGEISHSVYVNKQLEQGQKDLRWSVYPLFPRTNQICSTSTKVSIQVKHLNMQLMNDLEWNLEHFIWDVWSLFLPTAIRRDTRNKKRLELLQKRYIWQKNIFIYKNLNMLCTSLKSLKSQRTTKYSSGLIPIPVIFFSRWLSVQGTRLAWGLACLGVIL